MGIIRQKWRYDHYDLLRFDHFSPQALEENEVSLRKVQYGTFWQEIFGRERAKDQD